MAFSMDIGDRWSDGLVPCVSLSPNQSIAINVGQRLFRPSDDLPDVIPSVLEHYNTSLGTGEVEVWERSWGVWEEAHPGQDIFERTNDNIAQQYCGELQQTLNNLHQRRAIVLEEQLLTHLSTNAIDHRASARVGRVLSLPLSSSTHAHSVEDILRFAQQTQAGFQTLISEIALQRVTSSGLIYSGSTSVQDDAFSKLRQIARVKTIKPWLRRLPEEMEYPAEALAHDVALSELLLEMTPVFDQLLQGQAGKAKAAEAASGEEKLDDGPQRRRSSSKRNSIVPGLEDGALESKTGEVTEKVEQEEQRLERSNITSPFVSMVAAVVRSNSIERQPNLALLTARLYRHIGLSVEKSRFRSPASVGVFDDGGNAEFELDVYRTSDEMFTLRTVQNTLVLLDAVPLACQLIRQRSNPALQVEGFRLSNFLLLNLNSNAQKKFYNVMQGLDKDYPQAGADVLGATCHFLLNFERTMSGLRGQESLKALWEAKTVLKFLQNLCGKCNTLSTASKASLLFRWSVYSGSRLDARSCRNHRWWFCKCDDCCAAGDANALPQFDRHCVCRGRRSDSTPIPRRRSTAIYGYIGRFHSGLHTGLPVSYFT